jgi:hypothetical protein
MRVSHVLLFILLCLITPIAVRAQQQQQRPQPQQFTVVVHPKYGVEGNELTLSDSLEDMPSLYVNGKLQVVVGKSAKDAPATRGYILELEEPTINAFTGSQTGSPPAELRRVTMLYKGVYVIMPFTLWHRAAGGEPVSLGHGFVWNRVAQVKYRGNDGAVDRYEFVNQSQEQMIRIALIEKFDEFFGRLSAAWSPNVINQTPQPIPNEKQVAAMLRDQEDGAVHAPKLHGEIIYRPSRVSSDANGNAVVEVDLWNRLPVRAHGTVETRSPSGLPFNAAPPFHKSNVRFDLAPGEKSVARIVFDDPDDPRGDLSWFRNDEVSISLHSALGRTEPDPARGRANRANRANRGNSANRGAQGRG